MRRWRFLLAAGLLIAAGCGDRETETPATEEPAPTATTGVEVTEVTLGKAVGADKTVSEATTTFGPTDTIYVSVRTEGTASSATLAARWTFEDGQVVDESSRTIAPSGPAVTEFHVSKPDGWPAGRYEVAISLDGQPVESQSFTVEG
ncbi:MAG TPA: hypothetical protein VJP59_05715 [Gemmatimonadota bacterium]|nr:hypothetical protein [Gemmatimonadota bacterium]